MNPITQAILKAGLITPQQLEEMKRFSTTIDRDATVNAPVDLEQAAKLVQDALESEQYVLVRETDLEILRQYADTSQQGKLHVENDGEKTEFAVTFGMTRMGEYIIAWKSESIAEMMTNGQTFLRVGRERIFFKDVRELFFGQQKAFMLCVPSTREDHADRS